MEHKIYKIDNTNYLTMDGSPTTIKVLKGHAYLFLVPILEDGRLGARHEITHYSEGGSFPNIPGNENYKIILTGTIGTEVEAKAYPDEDYQQALEAAKELLIDRLEREEEKNRLLSIKQQELSDENFFHALENISSVVNRAKRQNLNFDSDEQPLVKVLKIIAEKSGGMNVKAFAGHIYQTNKTGLQKLAKDNNIRIREVVLRDKWYKEDNGHLIAFYKKEGDINLSFNVESDFVPVALIKNVERNGYVMVNPEDGSRTPVTKKNYHQIHPMAHMIYRAMNEEKITLKSVCKFVFTDIKADIFRFVLIGLLCTLIGLITPFITRNFIDYVIPEAAKSQAIQICILVFICNISAMIGSIAKYYANIRMETKADSDLESAVMDRLLKLPVGFFKNYSSGDLAARTMTLTTIRRQIFGIVLSCFMNFIFSFVYLIQEFRFCTYFAKWGILFCIFPIFISSLICFMTYKWEKMLVESQGKIQGMLLQYLNGVEKINNSHSEKRVFAQWSKEYIRQTKITYTLGIIGIVTSLINTIYPTLISILFYYLYGRGLRLQTIAGLTTGTFMAFLSAYSSFQSAFLGMAASLLEIRNVIPLTKRIQPILDAKPEIEESKPSVEIINGDIEINHLNFRYSPDGPLVLNDVNMSIKNKEFVAIVGTSGAGKSTLMRMLLGFEKPESGAIFFDNQDISMIDIGSLRRQMGVVLQNDTVLQGSILQNIVGSTGLREEDAWEAARQVALAKDIEEMPMGMMTMLPAGASILSGGQLQRLIIARAIIRKPKILIFDEATSALDNLTQMTVRESLDRLKVTRIIIAHRLSTIINADNIYVMKDGRVVESGNYQQLMEKDGYFAQLARRQNV
ncbi:MAG: NHLP bacteriocin export ABC transporter permease/ATPase subunit [Treponema sp.]|nr:NHLP bacteriocin export ABC transporter permease/ATPase subunit [Treponema sp.]